MFIAVRAFVDGSFVTTGDVLLKVFVLSERLGTVGTGKRFHGVGDGLDAKCLLRL